MELINMKGIHIEDAYLLVRGLGVETEVMDLLGVVDSYSRSLLDILHRSKVCKFDILQ
jgi:hypothetical protein